MAAAQDILTAVREAVRKRILLEDAVVTQGEYQREATKAPDADAYIRETVIFMDAAENFQGSFQNQYLVEFDIFVNRKAYPNSVTAELYRLGAAVCAAFNPRNTVKQTLSLTGVAAGVICWIDRLPQYNSVQQEGELFELPVLIYVNVLVPDGGSGTGTGA